MQIRHRGRDITLTKRGRYFQAVWYENGKRQRKSTSERTEANAIEAAKVLVDRRRRQSTEMRMSDALEKIWRERWQYQASDHRVTYFKQAMELWGDVLLADITRDMLVHLRNHFEAMPISEKTVNRRMQTVQSVLRAAYNDWEVLDKTPPRLKLRKESRGRYRYLTDDEITALLNAADPPFDLVYRFLIETGVRPGNELYGVTWAMVDTQYQRLSLLAAITKTGEPRTMPLSDDLLADLLETRGDANRNDPIFPSLTKAKMRRQWMKLRVRLDLEDDPDFVPYALRHTCATRLINAGVPTSTVQKWLGHTSITTTEHYLNQSPTDLDRYRDVASVSGIVSKRDAKA